MGENKPPLRGVKQLFAGICSRSGPIPKRWVSNTQFFINFSWNLKHSYVNLECIINTKNHKNAFLVHVINILVRKLIDLPYHLYDGTRAYDAVAKTTFTSI